ncbi:MAG TPA: serine--tRNA ligase [Pseudolabrys sp.]|nr:serine--tRNA ligase [Pseudolabrys sp.]
MYDIKWIRENADAFDRGLERRNLKPLSAKLVELDERRRAAITKSEQAQARRNTASKEIGQAKAKKDEATAQALMAEVATLKETMPALEAEQKKLGDELDRELAQIPNLPNADVPDGKDEHDNVEKSVFGKKRDYSFKPKEHFDLGAELGMMNFELAAKLSGARFVVLQKGLARLERALGQFFLDVHTSDEHGYTEVNPPLMVLDDVMFGTAQLPKFEEDQFLASTTWANSEFRDRAIVGTLNAISDLRDEGTLNEEMVPKIIANAIRSAESDPQKIRRWLIPTAEVPLTNLVRESIVDENSLPRRYTACTPCFRAEAGAAGRDTRGMIRQHQFTKVELVSITTPEESKAEHERMLACAEQVLKKLDLHYRVITLCTGDMGFASQKTYDIEVWLPGQNMYREISSCSVCGDFQARRMNARYRGKDGKPQFVHTLNGSGVAVGRALIAVMETYQQEDGSIAVPEALLPYMGGMTKIEKAK